MIEEEQEEKDDKKSKRAVVDWDKKKGDDSERISKKLEKRSPITPKPAPKVATKPQVLPPRIANGAPLLKLRKKIREVYDEEEEEEDDDVNAPFFNISLIDDDFEKRKHTQAETIRITKQQQMAGKLNIIMNTAVAAEKAGLNPKMTKRDARLANSATFDVKQIRRKTLEEKIEKPLGLKGEISEKDLPKAVKNIKNVQKDLPNEALKGMPADSLVELDKEDNPEEIARLILEKSGRPKPKKSLSELAKDIYQAEQVLNPEKSGKENDDR